MVLHGFYIRNVNDFAKDELHDKIDIKDISFDVIENSDTVDDTKLQFKKDASIPLTIGYVNNEIQKEYVIDNINSPLEHNGSILKRAGIPINSIKSKISFNIKIVNALDEVYKTSISMDLPITEEIYNGSQTVSINYNQQFKIEQEEYKEGNE